MDKKPNLIYCYDAYCGWSYGFSPVIRRLANEYEKGFFFEVLSGGLIISEEPRPISVIAGHIREAYKTVEKYTGVKFGKDYLWHIFNPDKSDWFPSSEKPAIALCILKEYCPDRQVEFASSLSYALHYEGRDLCDDEAYRSLLKNYPVPQQEFYQKLHSGTYKEKAYFEFSLVKQLQVSGFPAVLLQENESKFHVLAKGHTNFETLAERMESVLAALTSKSL
jgi:putative protein-disulfide isomerase